MIKYCEITQDIKIEGVSKQYNLNHYTYRVRKLVSDENSWDDGYVEQYNFFNLPNIDTDVYKKSRDRKGYHIVTLTNFDTDDGIHPMLIVNQKQFPNAVFTYSTYCRVLKGDEFTLKEIIDKQSADLTIQWLKEQGLGAINVK